MPGCTTILSPVFPATDIAFPIVLNGLKGDPSPVVSLPDPDETCHSLSTDDEMTNEADAATPKIDPVKPRDAEIVPDAVMFP